MMRMMKAFPTRILAGALIGLAALFCASALRAQSFTPLQRIAGKIDESQRVTLTGNTHPAANAKNDRGRVSPDLPMTDLILVLQPRRGTAGGLRAVCRQPIRCQLAQLSPLADAGAGGPELRPLGGRHRGHHQLADRAWLHGIKSPRIVCPSASAARRPRFKAPSTPRFTTWK